MRSSISFPYLCRVIRPTSSPLLTAGHGYEGQLGSISYTHTSEQTRGTCTEDQQTNKPIQVDPFM